MKTVNSYEVALPEYCLPYLINNDDSGIDAADKTAADNFMQQFYNEADQYKNGGVVISLTDDDPRFTWRPAFGLACTVQDAVIAILADDEQPAADYPAVWNEGGMQLYFGGDGAATQPSLF